MLNKKVTPLFIFVFLLGACAVTGPADDGYDNSNEWVENGRLGSEEIKTIYSSKEKQSPGEPSVPAKQVSSMVLDEKSEFEYFKIWSELRAKGVESEEYTEFLQWLKYQEFKANN